MVAVVTGGAQGIGRTIVEELIMMHCRVVIADIDELKSDMFLSEAVSNGHNEDVLKAIYCDLKQEGAVEAMLEEAHAWKGRIDIVCQCAGIFSKDANMARKVLETKLVAMVSGTQKAISLMEAQKGAKINCIVNIGSACGLKIEKVLPAFYSTCEQAVMNYTRNIGMWEYKNLDGNKIKVTCLCPASVETKNAKFNWDRRPSSDAYVKKHGTVNIVEVVKAFLMCLETDRHGKILSITPSPAGTSGIKEVA